MLHRLVSIGGATALIVGQVAYGADRAPATLIWDGARLQRIKAEGAKDAGPVAEARARLRERANAALRRPLSPVTDKVDPPPSGDLHDYVSYGDYWWPNPETADGLPFVRRDGQSNREQIARGDRPRLWALIDDLTVLGPVYYLSGDEAYAEHAAKLIRAWFVDPTTRMNPNLNYSQAVPGRETGRSAGVIDMRQFPIALDAVVLLSNSPSFPAADQRAFRTWCSEYLDWLRTSEFGREESQAGNNHGTWYDVQAVRLALFIGERDLARQIVEAAKEMRIAAHIEPDGRQPHEINRANGLEYSTFNLTALSQLARLAEAVGVDLWHYETAEGVSLRRATDYVLPYLHNPSQWPHAQANPMQLTAEMLPTFLLAAARFGDQRYQPTAAMSTCSDPEHDFVALLYP